MNLKTLKETAPWNWPKGTCQELLQLLSSNEESEADRVLGAELASELSVINAPLVECLLHLVASPEAPEALRGQAAISLGPVLELCDMDGFEDPEEVPITEALFVQVQEVLQAQFADTHVPKEVRRRILEASSRATADWHQDAIRWAFHNGDPNWQLTAVFCMGYVGGFEKEILEALASQNPAIKYLAISAAGVWEVQDAWPLVLGCLVAEDTDKPILLASIDAVASLRPREAQEVLADLLESDDDDVVEAASEAIGMAEERLKGHTEDDDDEIVSGDGTLN